MGDPRESDRDPPSSARAGPRMTLPGVGEPQANGSAQHDPEARYRALFERVPVGLYRSTPDGRILEANPALAEMLGYPSPAALMAIPAQDLYPDPAAREAWLARLEESGELTTEFEHLRADGTSIWVLDTARAVRGAGGEILYHEGMQQDVTKRKRMESALRENEARFRRLAENAPDVMYRYRLKPTRGHEYVSPAVTDMLGYSPAEHYANPDLWLAMVHPDDRAKLEESRWTPGGHPRLMRWIRKDGSIVWTEQRQVAILDEAGELVAIEGVDRDVTDRERAREHTERYARQQASVAELGRLAIAGRDPADLCREAVKLASETLGVAICVVVATPPDSPAVRLRAGVGVPAELVGAELGAPPPDSLLARTLANEVSVSVGNGSTEGLAPALPWERPGVGAASVLIGNRPSCRGAIMVYDERPRLFAAGEIRFLEGLANVLCEATRRKGAEDALRESEERFRGLYEGVPAGIYRATPDGKILDANPAMVRMLGFADRQSLLAVDARTLWADPADRARWAAQLQERGEISDQEIALRRWDGTLLWARDTSHVVRDSNGTIVAFEGIREDVTAAKAARDAAAETAEKLQALFDSSPVAILSLDLQNRVTGWNRTAEELFGWRAEEILGRPYPLVPEDGVEEHLEAWKAIRSGETFRNLAMTRLRKDGTPVSVLLSAAPLRDPSGEISGAMGALLDVSEQREVEDAVRKQRILLEQAEAIADIGSWELDVRTEALIWSSQLYRMFGLEPGAIEPTGQAFIERIHPDDRSRVAALIFEGIRSREAFGYECRIVRPDGSIRRVRAENRLLFDDDGEPVKVFGIGHDITEQLEREEQIRFQATILDEVLSAVVGTDLDGRITYCNNFTQELLGWPAAELVGRSLYELFSPDGNEEAFRQIGESVQEQGHWGGDLTCRRADGSEVPLQTSILLIRGLDGTPIGMAGVGIDISERLEAQRALQASFAELEHADGRRRQLLASLVRAQEEERRRIAEDIHDDTIQVMTAAGIRLGILRRQLPETEGNDRVRVVEETVEAAIARLRGLIFALRPPSLDREGLAAAIDVYLHEAAPGLIPDASFENQLDTEPSLETRAILYRIFQEAITNVRKHASAHTVSIRLAEDPGGYRLTIQDDGRGFDPAMAQEASPGHLGLLSMRERAELAGGRLRLESAPGEGTRLEAWLPRDVPSDGEQS